MAEKHIWRFFLVWYVCGVILVAFDLLPPWLEWANAVFLYAAGSLAIMYFVRLFGKRLGSILSIFIIIGTMFAESLGVKYGLIFGHYYYEKDFGLQLFGVPFTIGFAWIMVIATGLAITLSAPASLGRRIIYYPFIASLLAVSMDLIIDPVAFVLKQYWIWEGGGLYYDIPFKNFAGWFMTAFVIHTLILLLIRIRPIKKEMALDKKMKQLYFLVIFMFIVTAWAGQLYLAVMITLSFLIGTLLLKWRLMS
ncbi:putative membrane protein [Bacillus ectoiniformans]|uniref:carotenoid biosynthesis protein n=1 Tax=Bacillus ectoiniformans TaxID=1494429 RepID=UPI0019582EC9|nr:carotenoid biosynthesis protein [Bacillus ectoiniformans]MBM7647883.1 putative membrane protein [Bacillus ectoiniformans]